MAASHVYEIPRFLTRGRRKVALVVPAEMATAALQAVEDAEDLELMREGRESGPSIPLEQFRAELGL
ncbi:MAG: hypothetical protein DLM55_08765 [Acidimicrobiales bacterium]|nr:MAG: hypothetical protein DLM55_08765 [Acidimicrobiales bacterium]